MVSVVEGRRGGVSIQSRGSGRGPPYEGQVHE